MQLNRWLENVSPFSAHCTKPDKQVLSAQRTWKEVKSVRHSDSQGADTHTISWCVRMQLHASTHNMMFWLHWKSKNELLMRAMRQTTNSSEDILVMSSHFPPSHTGFVLTNKDVSFSFSCSLFFECSTCFLNCSHSLWVCVKAEHVSKCPGHEQPHVSSLYPSSVLSLLAYLKEVIQADLSGCCLLLSFLCGLEM